MINALVAISAWIMPPLLLTTGAEAAPTVDAVGKDGVKVARKVFANLVASAFFK